MKRLNAMIALKRLYTLRSLGYKYTPSIEEFELDTVDFLPNSLQQLRRSVDSCHLCDLAKTRTKTVFGEGNDKSPVVLVGEGPGEMEDKSGKPFVGRAGQLLTRLIKEATGLDREELYIANVVKCRPPMNRVPTNAEIFSCKPFLMRQLELISPKVVVALGNTALQTLMGQECSIGKMRGKVYNIGDMKLVPTFHPSYLLRNENATGDVLLDLRLAAKLAFEG